MTKAIGEQSPITIGLLVLVISATFWIASLAADVKTTGNEVMEIKAVLKEQRGFQTEVYRRFDQLEFKINRGQR